MLISRFFLRGYVFAFDMAQDLTMQDDLGELIGMVKELIARTDEKITQMIPQRYL